MEGVEIVSLCLRLDADLHRELTAEAKRRLRSLNSEIRLRLRQSLEQSDEVTAA